MNEVERRVAILSDLAIAMIDALIELGNHPMVGRMMPREKIADLARVKDALTDAAQVP